MTVDDDTDTLQPAATPPDALVQSLKKNDEVRKKVSACALELGEINLLLKQESGVAPHLPRIDAALAHAEHAEHQAQECADDLGAVDNALRREIDLRRKLESALADTRTALADTQARERNAHLRALHDAATGLPNRELFDDRLTHALAAARRHGWALAVMFIDLDRFKHVNDSHGHDVGDRVLETVAERLRRHARAEDTVCRNGGDEFLYLLVGPRSDDDVAMVARKTFEHIAAPMTFGHLTLEIAPSIGIAVHPRHGKDGKALIKNADSAMYRAKKERTGYVFFSARPDRGQSI